MTIVRMDGMIGLASGCLLVRLGLGLYGPGMIRSKNAAGAALRLVGDLCVASLAFWAVGVAILTGSGAGVFSFNTRALGFAAGSQGQLLFLLTVVLIGTGTIGGAVAERSRFFPMWGASALLAGLVLPLGAQWSWHGWLARAGFTDVGGSAWLHAAVAAAALAGAKVVGPRSGKYNRDGSASMIPGHNVPLATAGLLAMLAGWGPYLAGCLSVTGRDSLAGQAAADVLLSAAAAGAAAMLLGRYRYGKPDVIITLLGFLGGLVAVSAGAGYVSTGAAVIIGAVAGLVTPLCAIWLDLVARIDDPLGVIAVHGVGGAWGTLAAGLLMPGSTAERFRHLGAQALGLAVLAATSLVLSGLLFVVLRQLTRVRTSEADEFDGLDLAEHDIGAYPDFQQTMIKSYHLREA